MKIVQYPHPSLRHLAKPLTRIDADVRRYANEMLELMYAAKGLGLAAPQVALPYQIIVMNFTGDPAVREHECIAINPVIIEKKGGLEDGSEGCLSFPELYQKVRRHKTVVARAYDLEGRQYEMTCSELPARLWQHEVDHLHGVLYIDKMGPLGKISARGALHEFERKFRRGQEKGDLQSDADIERLLKELEAKYS
jgi:peptide deformylase